MRPSIVAALAVAVAACSPGGQEPPGRHIAGSHVDGGSGAHGDAGPGPAGSSGTCTMAATQACWTGDPGKRGVGLCHDGTQTCTVMGEFGTWSPCSGETLPATEIPGNCVDEDCDGIAQGCTCAELEDCGNSVDDNCDGLVDCDDPMCAGSSACTTHCAPSETCGNGIDDDCNGLVDAADPACCSCVPGATRYCDTPTYCDWGLQTCSPDGTWGECIETDARPPGCEGGGFLGFGGASYDEDCCVASGACCQDGGGSMWSRGNCAGISTCLH